MEEVPVVIVGAGPAGLTLALSLAKLGVKTITDDPRGVFLAGDAVRILHSIGLGPWMSTIGHELALETEVKKSPLCDLRRGATVAGRQEEDTGIIIEYWNSESQFSRISAQWLVGADGKTGVVRKHFLEPAAGIVQETGLFSYTGTWVAANLRIKDPTPETHPSLPLWKLGYTGQQIYDLFWPRGWHFCSPPGKPTASGRFGPHTERLWRHEFAELEWNDDMNSEELLWEHLLPMLTRDKDSEGDLLANGDSVTYPRDCIEILRCRPFTFAQKVVNKWFHNRTILIGDAAHVFPPFGGQGIACGIRDAHGLAWRLALFVGVPGLNEIHRQRMLGMWALERRQGVDDATRLTMANGMLTNEPERMGFYLFRKLNSFLSMLPYSPRIPAPGGHKDAQGYKATPDGFFLSDLGGGGKMAQVYLQSGEGGVMLSDQVLARPSLLALLAVGDDRGSIGAQVRLLLDDAGIDPNILSIESLILVSTGEERPVVKDHFHDVHWLCPAEGVRGMPIRPGYDHTSFLRRLGSSRVRFALVRPDFIIFAVAESHGQLGECLRRLQHRVRGVEF
ncbi:hypothetical protein ANO11243_018070 [Dothideomycetidae sp. 11243]|nr:hypothetical protein ANO11243_018070 [fungal sp. No.11243]